MDGHDGKLVGDRVGWVSKGTGSGPGKIGRLRIGGTEILYDG